MTELFIVLPSDIVYVAGYVNEVLTVFNQDRLNEQRWKASVDASEDSLYHVDIEMHDEAGNIGYFKETIEYILPVFVYDRTQTDVDRAKELHAIGWQNMTEPQKEEWMSGLKGCLNRSDLKRIENDIYVIARLLREDVQTNKDNIPELPDALYFQTLLNNVARLRETGYVRSDTPEIPQPPLNTYEKINDVEHILHDIYWIYNENNSRFLYCGTELYAGEEIGLI